MDAKELLKWAESKDRVFPLKENYDFAGAEHQVWFQDGRVFKAAVSPKTIGFGPDGEVTLVDEKSVEAYLNRKRIHNALFNDDFRLEGVCRSEDGRVIPVMSQPIMEGEDPDPEEIEEFFRRKGMTCVLPHIKGWYSESLEIVIADAHPRNLVKTRTGVSAFDLIITSAKKGTNFTKTFAIQPRMDDNVKEDEL